MDFVRQVTACLHREHVESLGLLERVEATLAKAPPAVGDASWARLMGELEANLANDIERHFAFEENALFPLVGADQDIAQLLAEEHAAIRALAKRIMPLLRPGAAAGSWPQFREMALELVERQVSHIQKEEMSLLPVLDDSLDAAQDSEMLSRYLAAA
jgi:hemerythrin-like domain-containing protein